MSSRKPGRPASSQVINRPTYLVMIVKQDSTDLDAFSAHHSEEEALVTLARLGALLRATDSRAHVVKVPDTDGIIETDEPIEAGAPALVRNVVKPYLPSQQQMVPSPTMPAEPGYQDPPLEPIVPAHKQKFVRSSGGTKERSADGLYVQRLPDGSEIQTLADLGDDEVLT